MRPVPRWPGAGRGRDGSWRPSRDPKDLRAQVHENLEHLGLDTLDVVNLRLSEHGTSEQALAEQFGTLAELRKGLVLSADAVADLDSIGG